MPFNAEFFARQLKVKRAERGWNQNELAEASGVSLGTIARYEMCANKPSFETICDLADALECSTDDFWERNERKAS